jgi:hypothetical protein
LEKSTALSTSISFSLLSNVLSKHTMSPVLTGYSRDALSSPLTAAIMIWSRSCSPPLFLFMGLKRSSRRVMLFFLYAPAMV